jgi:hypothetical protein
LPWRSRRSAGGSNRHRRQQAGSWACGAQRNMCFKGNPSEAWVSPCYTGFRNGEGHGRRGQTACRPMSTPTRDDDRTGSPLCRLQRPLGQPDKDPGVRCARARPRPAGVVNPGRRGRGLA